MTPLASKLLELTPDIIVGSSIMWILFEPMVVPCLPAKKLVPLFSRSSSNAGGRHSTMEATILGTT